MNQKKYSKDIKSDQVDLLINKIIFTTTLTTNLCQNLSFLFNYKRKMFVFFKVENKIKRRSLKFSVISTPSDYFKDFFQCIRLVQK